jgi:hypothetical protein
MRYEQTDAIVVSDSEYRAARKAEAAHAVELAKSLAVEAGVEEDTAVACARWLERSVITAVDLPETVGAHTASAGARKQQFTVKAKELQAIRDKNSQQ